MGHTTWIVTPCLFDVPSFLIVREETRAILADPVKFVVIDDAAGHDPEIAQLAELADVQVITPPYNLGGHQACLVYGLRTLRGTVAADDLVVTMDADGEDRPVDLPALLAPLLANPTDGRRIVLARRTRRHEGFAFQLGYQVFRLLFRVLTGTAIQTGSFIAYRGRIVDDLIFHPGFDRCYASTFLALPLRRYEVPIERGVRHAGRSRVGGVGLVHHALRLLLPFGSRIAVRGLIGTGVMTAGAMAAAVALGSWWLGVVAAIALEAGVGFAILFVAFARIEADHLHRLARGRE